MNAERIKALPRFLEVLGYDEEPMGIFYTDEEQADGFSPKPMDLPTREKEMKNQIDWQAVFGQFSCVIGNIWRARRRPSISCTFYSSCVWKLLQLDGNQRDTHGY